MTNDDVDVTTADESGRQDSPRARAAKRAEQLAHLRAELAAGKPLSAGHVRAAQRQLVEAHIRAQRAHLSAAEQHRRAAQTHERAAESHEQAADEGRGDVEMHREAAAMHRTASDDEYANAERAFRLAEGEADYIRSFSLKTP